MPIAATITFRLLFMSTLSKETHDNIEMLLTKNIGKIERTYLNKQLSVGNKEDAQKSLICFFFCFLDHLRTFHTVFQAPGDPNQYLYRKKLDLSFLTILSTMTAIRLAVHHGTGQGMRPVPTSNDKRVVKAIRTDLKMEPELCCNKEGCACHVPFGSVGNLRQIVYAVNVNKRLVTPSGLKMMFDDFSTRVIAMDNPEAHERKVIEQLHKFRASNEYTSCAGGLIFYKYLYLLGKDLFKATSKTATSTHVVFWGSTEDDVFAFDAIQFFLDSLSSNDDKQRVCIVQDSSEFNVRLDNFIDDFKRKNWLEYEKDEYKNMFKENVQKRKRGRTGDNSSSADEGGNEFSILL